MSAAGSTKVSRSSSGRRGVASRRSCACSTGSSRTSTAAGSAARSPSAATTCCVRRPASWPDRWASSSRIPRSSGSTARSSARWPSASRTWASAAARCTPGWTRPSTASASRPCAAGRSRPCPAVSASASRSRVPSRSGPGSSCSTSRPRSSTAKAPASVQDTVLDLVRDGCSVLMAEHRLDRLLPEAGSVIQVAEGRVGPAEPPATAAVTMADPPMIVRFGRGLGWMPVPLSGRDVDRRRLPPPWTVALAAHDPRIDRRGRGLVDRPRGPRAGTRDHPRIGGSRRAAWRGHGARRSERIRQDDPPPRDRGPPSAALGSGRAGAGTGGLPAPGPRRAPSSPQRPRRGPLDDRPGRHG